MRLLAENLLHDFLDLRHSGHTADQHHLADLVGCQARVLKGAETGLDSPLHEIFNQ
jgi:hypothetical protein